MSDQAQPSKAQHFWLIAGAIPFLISIFVLGISLNTGALTAFGIGWPLLQVFGYTVTLRTAKGDPSHAMVKAQVILHYIVLALVVALLMRAS